MRKRKYILLPAYIYICSNFTCLYGQDSTLHVLNETVITQNRYQSAQTGFKSQQPDTLIKNNFAGFALSDLFAFTNSFFIKNYGANGIASSSIRGSNAAQTTINWNGFTINNPMLGQSDLSILPAFFFEDITTVYGGNAGLAGSGAVGGTVYLNNKLTFGNALKMQAFSNYTSFGTLRNGFAFDRSYRRFTNSTKMFLNTGNSNFAYADTSNGEYRQKELSHTRLLQFGILQENYFLINKRQKAGIHAWLQSSNKELPNTTSEAISRKSQYDENIRISADWQLTKEKFTCFVRTAVLQDEINYSDSAAAVYSKSRSTSSITELETKWNINKQQMLDAGIQQNYSRAVAGNFVKDPHWLRYAAFATWQFENKKKWFRSTVGGRQEMAVNGAAPFTWNAGLLIKYASILSFHANAGKVFRFPSLNDLYWNPGGNPDLKPEQGYSQEAGIEISAKHKYWKLIIDVTAFNRDIKNWISWLPSGSGNWSPVNIQQVWSRGCETQTTLTFKKNKFLFAEKVNTNYIVSTYEKQINENDESIGRQLIYNPMYSGSSVSAFAYEHVSLLYVLSYTGYRYLTSDNYQYLPPYWLNNAALNYKWKHKQYEWNFQFGIDNLFNKNYQVVANNPMPLRYAKTGISLKFNK